MTTSARPESRPGAGQPDPRDRQRQRADRGIRSSATAGAAYRAQIPKPPRRRRPMMAMLAVLLIVGGAAVAGLLAVRLDSREEVVVVNRDIATGEKVTADMLGRTPVASEGLRLVPVDQVEAVIGTYSRVAITRGQLLETSMLTRDEPIGSDQAVVGVPLTAGRVPAGLRAGDLVRVVRIGDGAGAVRPLAIALVLDTATVSGDSLAGERTASSMGSLLVPTSAADAVVDAAGNDALGVSLIERGVPIDEARIQGLGGLG